MATEIFSAPLSHALKPICPRHNHEMGYEARGIAWEEEPGIKDFMASYHCGYFGCSVRYTNNKGYFSVADAPDEPEFIDEPGVNTTQCPRHHTWMYRAKKEKSGQEKPDQGFVWRCGVERCDLTLPDDGHANQAVNDA